MAEHTRAQVERQSFTLQEMRAHAAKLYEWTARHSASELTDNYRLAAGMIGHGADALIALAESETALIAKDAEITRLTEAWHDHEQSELDLSSRCERAETKLADERRKVRELREWHEGQGQASRKATHTSTGLVRELLRRDSAAHDSSLACMDALDLTGETAPATPAGETT